MRPPPIIPRLPAGPGATRRARPGQAPGAALGLPGKAVVGELKAAHVFGVKDDLAEKRAVEIGLEEDEQLEIVSGIEAGEQVVVAGQGSLKDGSKIKVLESDESTQASNLENRRRPARG